MKNLFLISVGCIVALAVPGQSSSEEYGKPQRYNDSLLVYKTFKTQIETIKVLKQTDFSSWVERIIHDENITKTALLRLDSFNKQPYGPIDSSNREGFGIGYAYPAPSMIFRQGAYIPGDYAYKYAIIDDQVRFLVDSTGKTRIPYVLRWKYDRGSVVAIDSIDPRNYTIIRNSSTVAKLAAMH